MLTFGVLFRDDHGDFQYLVVVFLFCERYDHCCCYLCDLEHLINRQNNLIKAEYVIF